jgi:hypothetical protein
MTSNPTGGWRQDFGVIFISLFVAGLVLRVALLGHASYWIDEIPTIGSAISQKSISSLYQTELDRFTSYHHLPFLDVVPFLFIKLVGFSGPFPPEWLSRLPFALLGALTLPLLFFLGKAIKDRTVGLWAMFLGTFSIFHVFYSREAYAYSLLIFFVAGTSWLGVRLVQDTIEQKPLRWPLIVGYMLFSAGFLHAHLGALLFLVPWNAMMIVAAIWWGGVKSFFKMSRIGLWALTLGVAYVAFLPFLLRLMGGYTSTDSPTPFSFTRQVIPAVLGRMGWGESVWALLPFAALFLAGCAFACSGLRQKKPNMVLLGVAQILVYFVFQSWMQKKSNSRFEVRYYSPLYPLLLATVAVGMEQAVQWASMKLPKVSDRALRAGVAAVLLLWLAPSLWWVVNMQCRGVANYKGIADWIMKNVPENGIYSFYNVYELRGVPQVYPTPGRTPTSVSAWSSRDDFNRVQPPKRMESLFTRFPQIYFIELAPSDILAPVPNDDFLPRDKVFARHEWIEDPTWDKLSRFKTFPLGDLPLNATNIHKVLISYNKLEDMPQVAARRGEKFYHYFGPEWRYYRDQRMKDWLVNTGHATLYVGNATDKPLTADLILQVMAPPRGCRWSLFLPNGKVIVDNSFISAPPGALTVRNVVLLPGAVLPLTLQVLPPPNNSDGNFCVYGVQMIEAQPPPAAASSN